MPTRFDPYHKWLGIPPAEQPPHHYRLLGVQPFESDPDVISNASDQRMSLLKTFGTSAQNSLAEEMLNEVARARVCLLNLAKKQAYDSTLREKLSVASEHSHALQGFWLPPLHGAVDVLEVACPHCDDETDYDVPPSAQVVACERCGKPMWVPGREEVARAMAQLEPRKRAGGSRPISHAASGSANVSKSRESAQRVPTVDPSEHAGQGNAAAFDAAQISPIIDTQVTAYRRRRRSKRALFSIILWFLGAIIGLLAGYLVICMIDPDNDFLNLIPDEESTPNRNLPDDEPAAEPRDNRSAKPKPKARIKRVPRNNDPPNDAERGNEPEIQREASQPDVPIGELPVQMPLPVPRKQKQPASLSITFDLTKSIQRAVCECEDLPDVDELRVDIIDLENCPPYQVNGGELLGLKLNDKRVLRYSDAPNAYSTIKFRIYQGRPAISFETRYQMPGDPEQTLEIRQNEQKLEKLRKSAQLRNSQAMRMKRDSFEQVAELANQLHEKVIVRFRFYRVVDGHEIEFATTQQ